MPSLQEQIAHVTSLAPKNHHRPRRELLAEAADFISIEEITSPQPPKAKTVLELLDEVVRRLHNFPTVHLDGAGDMTITAVNSMESLATQARALLA